MLRKLFAVVGGYVCRCASLLNPPSQEFPYIPGIKIVNKL
jgi:hypothetical protein